jgi:hypothetical protein
MALESRFVTQVIKRKLLDFVISCLVYILKSMWPKKVTNTELWPTTGQSDINLEIRTRGFGWMSQP